MRSYSQDFTEEILTSFSQDFAEEILIQKVSLKPYSQLSLSTCVHFRKASLISYGYAISINTLLLVVAAAQQVTQSVSQ